MRLIVVLGLAVALLAPVAYGVEARHAVSDEHASLSSASQAYAWPTYPYAEEVCFAFTNEAGMSLWFPSSAPWRILDGEGNEVYAPVALAVLVEVESGQSVEHCWDGIDNTISMLGPVSPGDYNVEWSYVDPSPGPFGLRSLTLPLTLAVPILDG